MGSSTPKSSETTLNGKSSSNMNRKGEQVMMTILLLRLCPSFVSNYDIPTRPPPHTATYARFLWLICSATRQALRYLIRNTTLPQSVRNKAKLQLARMHSYTRSTPIRNRCIMGGVARSVFRDFRMGRVSRPDVSWQKGTTPLHTDGGSKAFQD